MAHRNFRVAAFAASALLLSLIHILSIAYTAGVCAGKAATHMEEDDELKIYMDHTHGEDEQ